MILFDGIADPTGLSGGVWIAILVVVALAMFLVMLLVKNRKGDE